MSYDDYSWRTFVAQLIATGIFTVGIKLIVNLTGHWIAWIFALLIAAAIVFGGVFILDSDDIHEWFH
jgi:hypothetical protein